MKAIQAMATKNNARRARGAETGERTEPTSVGKGLIIGIGASAGGLNAFKSFLSNVPVGSGMAFILIQHLSPDHKSILADLLGKATTMPVVEAVDGMLVEANRVFVIPPDSTLTLKDRRLQVIRPAPPRERRRPIDTFFSSLAEDQGENAVCIVLAGTGSDGSLGLKQIKESGGMTLAQAEVDHTAMSGMPHSAAATGLVDHVLPVEEMPAKLLDYQRHLLGASNHKDGDGTRIDAAEHLASIIALLRNKIGHDFGKYKEKTITRRIQRRMQVLQIETVSQYVARLRDDPHQIELLFRELLIGVTQFFRDPDAFEALQRAMVRLLDGKGGDGEIRIWIPACATGEEAYSVAILMKEAIEQRGVAFRVQIFGTDIDDVAVAFARAGRYRKTTGISSERLARWFTADDDEVLPIREIREMCVFSPHSVVKDPPFSRLNLISCRNLLIYMDAELQDRVLRIFHYALKPDGFLFLGPSEAATRQDQIFAAFDKKHHIFQRRDADAGIPKLPFASLAHRPLSHSTGTSSPSLPSSSVDEDRIDSSARRALAKYSPAYVVVDQFESIVRYSGGEVGRYLEPSPGAANLNLFKNLRKALRPVIRTALQAVLKSGHAAVHDGVKMKIEDKTRTVSVIVEPIFNQDGEAGLFVIAFREMGSSVDEAEKPETNTMDVASVRAAEQELRSVRTQLQATIDELETANEEMKSAAEEYQSVNEELQSTNEELETSKEEMQSINEELQTVNAEMSSKNDLLMHLNSDLKNLLDSTQIPTMFLDNSLRIKSYTPGMTQIFHLREGDRGRPITDIATLLTYDDLRHDATAVLRDLATVEREVELKGADATFIMRVRPYRTIDNVIDGVVMTFVDISQRRAAAERTALLLAELDHRVKNILAVVASVIAQTLKSSPNPEEFGQAMEGRIAAITRAHSLLTHSGSEGDASLRDLLTVELAPYERGAPTFSISGVDVVLTPRAGLSLAMAFHELASNAAKYGALSAHSGALAVSWAVELTSQTLLKIVWEERGGPAIVETPTRRGFGSTLIERTLTYEMDAVVRQEFRASGLYCTIDIPLNDDIGQVRVPPR